MKLRLLFLSALLLMAGALFAQTHNHRDGADTKEGRQKDGSYSFKTVDVHGNNVTVVVEPKMPKLPDNPRDIIGHDLYEAPFIESEALGAKGGNGGGPGGGNGGGGGGGGAVTVDVYVVADEEYRAAHGNWEGTLGSIIEKADNAYSRDQNIDWNIVGYYEWNSNGRNASRMLSELSSEAGNLGPGLVMGFTADSNFDAGGIAYVYSSNPGTGYSICVDQGSTYTVYALRHEIGHNYSCSHDFDPVVCMMNYTYAYSVDYFDSAHEAEIDSHRNWFQ